MPQKSSATKEKSIVLIVPVGNCTFFSERTDIILLQVFHWMNIDENRLLKLNVKIVLHKSRDNVDNELKSDY